MFGHLYRISQQSHKSAPTGIRGICLKPIINALWTGDDASNNPAPVSAFLASTRVGTPYKR